MADISRKKVLVLCSYKDSQQFKALLQSLPPELKDSTTHITELLLFADHHILKQEHESLRDIYSIPPEYRITMLQSQSAYGKDCKTGFYYAVHNAFDFIIQALAYQRSASAFLNEAVRQCEKADAVICERNLPSPTSLLHVPFYELAAIRILTFATNAVFKRNSKDPLHPVRVYNVKSLYNIPYQFNADTLRFDYELFIQMMDTGKTVLTVTTAPCRIHRLSVYKFFRYYAGMNISLLLSRLMKWTILYHPKFDYGKDNTKYTAKFGFPSSHQFAFDRVKKGSVVLDVGSGPGFMACQLSTKMVKTISLDREIQPIAEQYSWKTMKADVESYKFLDDFGKIDTILILDMIEHLKNPEQFLTTIRERFAAHAPEIIITTANVSFILIRITLALGLFNYGKKGILDLDHTRLFTFYSLRRTLRHHGYDIVRERGIPVPLPLILGNNKFTRLLMMFNTWLIGISKSMFSYQMAFVVTPRLTADHLIQNARTL